MNRAIVQRTFGLFELNKPRAPQLSYGSRFRYDEFNVSRGYIGAYLTSAIIAVGLFSLATFAPVRWLYGRIIPSSGIGPSEAYVPYSVYTSAR